MPWLISFHIWGEQFMPSSVDFQFTEFYDAGSIRDRGRYRGLPSPNGAAYIEVPSHIPNLERIKYIVETVLPILPELRRAGATDFKLDIGRFYSTQCNEELSAEQIALIAQLNCPLTYSAYQVEEAEEMELAKEYETFERYGDGEDYR